MCLIAFAIAAQPGLPLLLAGNRDEFFERPTERLHRWPSGPGIWAGRDGRDGGTWLGLAENGRVALLTNVRSVEARSGPRSRGELPTRWLQGDGDVEALAGAIDPAAYAGFNLVVGDLNTQAWHCLGNRDPQRPHDAGAPVRLHRRALAPGVYGLSNAVLDTPWPKTQRLKAALRAALPAAGPRVDAQDDWQAGLQAALADAQRAEPDQRPQTGVPAELEAALSSPFVHLPERGYGTRSSLLLRVQAAARGWQGDLHEWTHTPAGWGTETPRRHQVLLA